jgi:energy-coupling factor transporter ATP-binding protein EcfA2
MANEGARRTVNVWVDRSKSLRVLVFGKTGAGKSSLINTLFGDEVAREGDTLYSETKVVRCYTRMIALIVNDVHITLWDTPGLKDPFSDGRETIKEIGEKCGIGDIDLFVYCTRFDQTRLGQDDVDCIRDITKAFGDGIWKRALFALTFANQATIPPSNTTQTLQEYFQLREKEWKKGLHRIIKDNVNPMGGELSVGKIDAIPVISTGYGDRPLPGGTNWFVNFWAACLSQVKFFTIPALIRAASDRVQSKLERAITARIVGQRVAEVGDHIRQELEAEMQTDEPGNHEPEQALPPQLRIVATMEWADILIEAIQNDLQTRTTPFIQTFGHTLAQHKTGLLLSLVAGVAIVCILHQLYRKQ